MKLFIHSLMTPKNHHKSGIPSHKDNLLKINLCFYGFSNNPIQFSQKMYQSHLFLEGHSSLRTKMFSNSCTFFEKLAKTYILLQYSSLKGIFIFFHVDKPLSLIISIRQRNASTCSWSLMISSCLEHQITAN